MNSWVWPGHTKIKGNLINTLRLQETPSLTANPGDVALPLHRTLWYAVKLQKIISQKSISYPKADPIPQRVTRKSFVTCSTLDSGLHHGPLTSTGQILRNRRPYTKAIPSQIQWMLPVMGARNFQPPFSSAIHRLNHGPGESATKKAKKRWTRIWAFKYSLLHI